jgi:alpha-beta hydrolase superfamily lysophospholipase/SAM-dependent methyltransferase
MTRLFESEHSMTSWDGTTLFYRLWQPPAPADRALVLFHRGHEHSGRFDDVVEALAPENCAVFAWDARGHGRSPGERGSAPSFGCLVKDAQAFVSFIAREHKIPVSSMAVLGVSVGAVLAAAWVHDLAPPVRALALVGPAFRVRLYVPAAIPLLRLRQRLRGAGFVQSYVKAALLTRDPDQARRYRTDPLVTRAIAVNVLLGLHDTARRLLADAHTITVPTLVLTAGSDWVVDGSAQRRFFERLGSPRKAFHAYPGFRHDLFHERDRGRPIAAARAFLEEAFEAPPGRPGLPRSGVQTVEALAAPLPAWSPRRWKFSALRALLRTVGRLSQGVAVGWQYGFDSGASLDYVYQDTPRGLTPLGRWLDRVYLATPGWRAIRERKRYLEQALRTAIMRVRAEGKPVRIVDVAAGPGRYVLEVLRACPEVRATARLLDRDPVNVEAGRRLAAALSVPRVTFACGDAFDRRPREPRPGTDHRRRVGALRAVPRQRADPGVAARAAGGSRGRRLPGLHEPAVAPAARADRAGPHQPRGSALGHALPPARRDRRAGGDRGVREARHGHRRGRHLHRVGRPDRIGPGA